MSSLADCLDIARQTKGAVSSYEEGLLKKWVKEDGLSEKYAVQKLIKMFEEERDAILGQLPLREMKASEARTAMDIIRNAAKHGVKGADEALTGLFELFGGRALRSFPGAIDEETYRKAKPHFEAALEEWQAAGKDFRDLVRWLMGQFAGVKPYLQRWVREIKGEQEEPSAKPPGEEEEIKTNEPAEGKGKKPKKERKKKEGYTRKLEDVGEEMAGARKSRDHAERTKAIEKEINEGTSEHTPERLVNSLLSMTEKAKLFPVRPLEGRSPGAERFLENFKNKFVGFVGYAGYRSGGTKRKWGTRHKEAILKVARGEIRTTSYGGTYGPEQLRLDAAKYVSVLEQNYEVTKNLTSISDIRDALFKLWAKTPEIAQKWKDKIDEDKDVRGSRQGDWYQDADEFSDIGNDTSIFFDERDRRRGKMAMGYLFSSYHDSIEREARETKNKEIVRTVRKLETIKTPDKYRHGKDVTGEDLIKVFGVRGVEFGNWDDATHTHLSVNLTFDSLHMLSETLGIPLKGISIKNGDKQVLGLAFGARGRGKYAAHFEPDNNVINLTKTKGDGSLAHEWGHALDFMGNWSMAENENTDYRQMNARDDLYETLKRTYQTENLEKTVELILRGLWRQARNLRGETELDKAKNFLKERWESELITETHFFHNAKQLDGGKRGKYYSRSEEMFARAVDAYIADKMQGDNFYLTDKDFVAPGAVEKRFNRENGAYPTAKERDRFNQVFDEFFAGIEWTEAGEQKMKPSYVPVSLQERARVKIAIDKILTKLDDIYAVIHQGKPSEDGLYWYAYKGGERGSYMQPKGYRAYDDSWVAKDADKKVTDDYSINIEGMGAIGYDQSPSIGDIVKFNLHPITHPNSDSTVYLEEEVEDEIQARSPEGVEGFEAEDDPELGGARRPPRGPEPTGRGSDTENQGTGEQAGTGLGGSGEPGEGGVNLPPKRERDAGVTPEPLALDVNYTITSTDIALGRNPSQRFSDNVAAIQLVKKIESEGRKATPAEQKTLVRFSGWGGFSEALYWGEVKEAWKAKANILKEILTEEELNAARESALTSFYTPPAEVSNIWYALERLGFDGGRVLDPSCGIGHFFGLMPEGMRERSSLLGIDMDHISSLIAKHLYQESKITNAKFEDVTLPNDYFDLVTTNVPFMETRPHDRKHNPLNLTLHDYFINKALDLVRPGGIVAVITSTGTMDKADTMGRQAFAKKADLIGALRVPNDRYDAAQAASDILFLRKKSKAKLPEIQQHPFLETQTVRVAQMNSARTEATQRAVGIAINEYFTENKDAVLGRLAAYNRYGYGNDECYVAADTENFEERLREAIEKLPINVIAKDEGPKELNLLDMVSKPEDIKNQNFYINESDGKIYLNHDGKPEPFEIKRGYPESEGVIRKFIDLRGTVRNILRSSLEGKPEPELKALRQKLKNQYVAFVKKYGPVNSPKNQAVILQDVDAGSVLGLEHWDDDNEEVTGLAAIFDRNTLPDYKPPVSVETPRDALVASLIWKGKINLPYMQSLWKGEREAMLSALQGMIYDDPEKGWVTADEYLAGDVRHKLRVAQAAVSANPEYETNVKALEVVQPKILTIDEITVRLGSAWIPTDTIEDFLNDTFKTYKTFNVQFIPEIGTYVATVRGSSQAAADRIKQDLMGTIEATATYGTQKVNFFTSQSKGILDFALGGGAPRVTETRIGADKKEYTVFMEKETDAAAAALDRLHQGFARWVAKSNDHRSRLEKIYNEKVNVYVGKRPDGSHLTLPGKVPDEIIRLRVHQKNAIWRFLTDGIAYFAHDVGTGKTYTQVASIMEAKRLGLARKPMWAVKRETFEQIKSDFHKLYPAANVLFLNVPHVAEKRRKVLNSVALNDFDCVVVTHESFTTIPVSKETQSRFIQEEIDQLKIALEMQRRATTDIGRGGLKKKEGAAARELQKRLKKREEALKRVLDVKKDEVFTFEEMGIDMLVVDEMHQFKNVNIVTEHQNVKGVAIEGSGRAEDLMMKVRHLHETVGRNIIFASGTPITNSVVEIYNLMKFMMPDYMKRMGVYHFDRWLSSFVEIGQEAEYSPSSGGFQISTKVKNIINRPELARTLRQYMDVVKADDIPELKRPKMKGGAPVNIKVEPVPFQKAMSEVLIARTAHIKAVGQGKAFFHRVADLMLRIVNDGRSLSADPRVFDPRLPDMPGTKVHKLVEKVLEHYKQTYDAIDPETGKEYQEGKGTQLIFCDRGVPGSEKKGRFNLYEEVKQQLIKGGIPESEIAIIHEVEEAGGGIKGKDKAKLRLYKRINAGRVRVLIANTAKASTGVNVQERVAAIHHYDADWNYANWEQRTGRGWRHGNRLKEVAVYNYGVSKSLDAFMWSKISDKARVLNDVTVDSDEMRTMNADVSYNEHSISASEALAAFADDPIHKEKVELEAKVRRLENQLSVFNTTRADKRRDLIAIPGQIDGNKNAIQRNQKYKPIADQITAVRIGNEFFDLDKQGGDANRAAEKIITGEVKKLLEEKSLDHKMVGEFGFLTEKTETYPAEEKYDEEVKEETKGANKKGDKWVISKTRTIQKERKVKVFNPIPSALLTAEARAWGKGIDPDYHVRIGKAINHAGSMESISRVVTGLKTGIERNISDAEEAIKRLQKAQIDIADFLDQEFQDAEALQKAQTRLREVVQALLEKEGESGNVLRNMNEADRFALIDEKTADAYEGVPLGPGIGPILRAQLARQASLRKQDTHDPGLDQEIERALAESQMDRTRVEVGDEVEEFKGITDPAESVVSETGEEKPENENRPSSALTRILAEDGEDLSLSLASGTPTGLTKGTVEALLVVIRKNLPSAPKLVAVQDYVDLPDAVKTGKVISNLDETTKGMIKGVHHIDEHGNVNIYLVASNFNSARDVFKTGIHEIVGHEGWRGVIPPEKANKFLDDLYDAKKNDPLMVEFLGKYKFDVGTPYGRRKAADEWFARTVVQKGHKDPSIREWWNRFVRMFREWVRKVGLKVMLSDAEIADVMNRAWGQMQAERPGREAGQALDLGPAKEHPLLSTIRSLQTPGQPRELVSISKLREAAGEGGNRLKIPQDWMDAFDLGKIARKEGYQSERQFWQDVAYKNTFIDHPSDPSRELQWSHGKTQLFRMGFNNEELPEYVRGWRYGKAPESERSWNFKDQKAERGISLMALEKGEPTEGAKLYAMFNRSGKKKVWYEGWMIGYGSDGEPLIIGAKESPNPTRPPASSLDSQLLDLARQGKVVLHKGDFEEGGKGLVVENPNAYRGKEYYVGVVPTGKGEQALDLTDTIRPADVNTKETIPQKAARMSRAVYGEGTDEARKAIEAVKAFAKSGQYWEATPNKITGLAKRLGFNVKRGGSSHADFFGRDIYIQDTNATFHEVAHSLFLTKTGMTGWIDPARGEWKALNDKWTFMFTSKNTDYSSQTERYADLFERYISDNAEVKRLAPSLYAKVERLFDDSAPVVSAYLEASKKGKPYESAFTYLTNVFNRGTWSPTEPDISLNMDAGTVEDWNQHVQDEWKKRHPDSGPKIEEEKKALKETLPKESLGPMRGLLKLWKARGANWREGKPDTTVLDRILSVPSHHFEKVPALQRMFEAALEKSDQYYELVNALTKGPDGRYHTETMDSLRKTRPEEYKKFQDYLITRDRNQVGYRVVKEKEGEQYLLFDPKRNKVGTFGTETEAWSRAIASEAKDYRGTGASDQAVESLLAARMITHKGFHVLIRNLRNIIAQYEAQGWDLPKVAVRSDGKGVEVDLKVAVAMMGDMRGYYFPRIRRPGRFMLIAKKEGVNPIMEFFDTKTMIARRQLELEKEGYSVEKDLSPALGEDVFDMAKSIIGMQAQINEALKRVHSAGLTLDDFGLRVTARQIKPGKRDVMITGPTSRQHNEVFKKMGGRFFPSDPGGPRVWHFENPGANFEKRLAKALANEVPILDQETQLLFAKALAEQVANVIKARGHRAHMIERKLATGTDVWVGYEEDPVTALAKYARGLAAGESKKNMALRMVRAFTGTDISWQQFKQENEGAEYEDYLAEVDRRRIDPAKQPNAFREGKVYMEDILRNEEWMDRAIGTIKGAAVLKYLGFRIAAPAVNLTALVTSVPAAMQGFGGIPITRTFRLLGQAMTLYRQYKGGDKAALAPDVLRMFQEMERKGWDTPQQNQEGLAVLEGKLGRGWNRLIETSMWMFGKTEQLNRAATIAASYLGVRQVQPDLSHEDALLLAKKISDRAHGTYRKANLPHYARGGDLGAQLIKMFYVFRTFSHNYLLTMKELGFDQKNAKAFSFMLLSPAVLAGAGATVATPIIQALARALGIGGDDPEEEFYKWLDENLGEYGERFGRSGLFGLAGVSLKGSLQIGITDLPTSITDILGAPGSVAKDLYDGARNLTRGDVLKGAEKILPNFAASVSRAYRETTEGVTTQTNAPVFWGRDPLVADTTESILRAMSFNPARIGEIREQLYRERRSEANYTEKRIEIYSRFKKFYHRPEAERSEADYVDLMAMVERYNREIEERGLRGKIPSITWRSIRTNLIRSFRPSKRERIRAAEEEED